MTINPWGVNTPVRVYGAIRNSGLVQRTSYVYPDEGEGLANQIASINMSYYPGASHHKTSRPAVLGW
jgi:hypothetical protein